MYRFKKNEKKMNVRSLPVIFRLFSDTSYLSWNEKYLFPSQ